MSLLYRALMYAGSWFCQQLPARSPHLFGVQLPLCWRCTGILFGALALFFWLMARKRIPPLGVCVLLSLLLPLDVFQAILTHGDGSNARRLVTGLLWGFFATGAALRLVILLSDRFARSRPRRRSRLNGCAKSLAPSLKSAKLWPVRLRRMGRTRLEVFSPEKS